MATKENVLRAAMTASQLIEELSQMDEDAPVFFVCDYGDHCHTQQALPVAGVRDAESSDLRETGYSSSGFSVVDNRDDSPLVSDDDDDCEYRQIVVLS